MAKKTAVKKTVAPVTEAEEVAEAVKPIDRVDVVESFVGSEDYSTDEFADSPFAAGLTSTSAEVRKARASVLTKRVAEAQIDLIRGIKSHIASLKDKLSNLLDLRAQTTMDLRIKNIDPVAFTGQIQEISEELYSWDIKLNVAVSTYKKLFGRAPRV